MLHSGTSGHMWQSGPPHFTPPNSRLALRAWDQQYFGGDNGTQFGPLSFSISPKVSYQVKFNQVGRHYLWIDGVSPNSSGDSLYVGIDGRSAGSDADIKMNVNDPSLFRWSNLSANDASNNTAAYVDVETTGYHTIDVWMHEDGFVFDRITLSNSSMLPAFVESSLE